MPCYLGNNFLKSVCLAVNERNNFISLEKYRKTATYNTYKFQLII